MFSYDSIHQDNNYPGIIPAKKTIPEWYKKIPSYLKPREGINHFGRDISTVKKCIPFFEGLIPEGWLLNIATTTWKINRNDRMGLLIACCENCIARKCIAQRQLFPNFYKLTRQIFFVVVG